MNYPHRSTAVPVIGIVGGVLAGKSSLVNAMRPDSRVVIVPEAPTTLYAVGILPHPTFDADAEGDMDVTRWVYEKHAARVAAQRGAVAVLADRIVGEGRMVYCQDLTARLSPQMVKVILDSYHTLVVLEMPPREVWYANRPSNGARTKGEEYDYALRLRSLLMDYIEPHPRKIYVDDSYFPYKIQRGVRVLGELLTKLESIGGPA